ncbi:hypothetical protein Acsp03_04070 [Actinomadura sp. NBRC 104412]|uniref:hypothetical protein n=1 Tax=Actinomadura sp. NBRC 104412 TaxID=3032203 RepID=UPI0024A43E7A|nr:hypothetical protein [Actinomadura sp. NBRC 104412]GLZ02940.1 hypothetical protein Acsp03_04070 [Actinomadura sp. NBRC 104412]
MRWKAWSGYRGGNAIGCLVACGPAFVVATSVFEELGLALDGWPFAAVSLLILAAGILLAVNCLRLGVDLHRGQVVVHGFIKTTRIPAAAVVEVDVYRSRIAWRKPDGRRRSTRVLAFDTPLRHTERQRRHNERTMEEIQARLLGSRGY